MNRPGNLHFDFSKRIVTVNSLRHIPKRVLLAKVSGNNLRDARDGVAWAGEIGDSAGVSTETFKDFRILLFPGCT
jgi:hypothetical protein